MPVTRSSKRRHSSPSTHNRQNAGNTDARYLPELPESPPLKKTRRLAASTGSPDLDVTKWNLNVSPPHLAALTQSSVTVDDGANERNLHNHPSRLASPTPIPDSDDEPEEENLRSPPHLHRLASPTPIPDSDDDEAEEEEDLGLGITPTFRDLENASHIDVATGCTKSPDKTPSTPTSSDQPFPLPTPTVSSEPATSASGHLKAMDTDPDTDPLSALSPPPTITIIPPPEAMKPESDCEQETPAPRITTNNALQVPVPSFSKNAVGKSVQSSSNLEHKEGKEGINAERHHAEANAAYISYQFIMQRRIRNLENDIGSLAAQIQFKKDSLIEIENSLNILRGIKESRNLNV